MDRNALDWIFSTLPQALAALSGLIFTGVTFVIGHIENKGASDDSLIEIMDVMKSNIHKALSNLFWICGVLIVMDVVAVFLNPIRDERMFSLSGDWDWYYTIVILLFIFNVFALYKSISFVLSIVNPNYVASAIGSLKKRYDIQQNSSSSFVDGIEFIRLFQEFEMGLRNKVNNETNGYFNDNKMTIFQILDFLYKHEIIDRITFDELRHINSLRNVLVHGSIDEKVPKKSYDRLESFAKDYLGWPKISW